MGYVLYADESGISGPEKCYTIGSIIIEKTYVCQFEREMKDLKESHGIMGEIRWKKVNKSHGLINFGIDAIKKAFQDNIYFNAIVVNKSLYRNWHNNKEKAFYQTYTQLLKHCAGKIKSQIAANIDNRNDSYNKHQEVVEIIANNMLQKEAYQMSRKWILKKVSVYRLQIY